MYLDNTVFCNPYKPNWFSSSNSHKRNVKCVSKNLCNVFQSWMNLSFSRYRKQLEWGIAFCKCYINDAKRRNVFADVKSRSDEKVEKYKSLCTKCILIFFNIDFHVKIMLAQKKCNFSAKRFVIIYRRVILALYIFITIFSFYLDWYS